MRALLAIGCDQYDHSTQLEGAERDAQRVFDALTRPEVGEYDPTRSQLLLSPSYEQFRQALKSVLFAAPRPETFTLFFAGHGSVSSGAFYLWVKDSDHVGLSMSAVSLADLFRSLNEAAPQQSNVIIDACESGGLIEDLGALLKPGLLGNAGSPGLTLVATSAQDQLAGETDDGGIGTVALLDCIEGRDFVQDHKPTLDLVEIGMRVSERLRGSGQSPVVWGLNLFGASGFAKNPRFGRDPATPLRQALQAWPTESNEVIRRHYDALWAAYSATGGVWDFNKFSDVVRAVLHPFMDQPAMLEVLVERLATTFLQRATEARDPFRRVEVAATLAVALLRTVDDANIAATAQRLLDAVCIGLLEATEALVADLTRDRFALLSDRSGMLSEFHELPARLTKVLGWSAAATFICAENQRPQAEALFAGVVRLLLELYGGSITSFTDAQAAGLTIALAACMSGDLRDEGETLAGLHFNSLVQYEGRIATVHMPHADALEYLLARCTNDFSACQDVIARPVALLTVLLKAAPQLDLEDVFDEALSKIDGLAFSAYVPADYMNYGETVMPGGDNLVWGVGHDVFRTQELISSWPAKSVAPQNNLIASLAIVASLLYPDRQAWFLLEP